MMAIVSLLMMLGLFYVCYLLFIEDLNLATACMFGLLIISIWFAVTFKPLG